MLIIPCLIYIALLGMRRWVLGLKKTCLSSKVKFSGFKGTLGNKPVWKFRKFENGSSSTFCFRSSLLSRKLQYPKTNGYQNSNILSNKTCNFSVHSSHEPEPQPNVKLWYKPKRSNFTALNSFPDKALRWFLPLSSAVLLFFLVLPPSSAFIIWSRQSSSSGCWSGFEVRWCRAPRTSGCHSRWPWCAWPGSLQLRLCWDCPERHSSTIGLWKKSMKITPS